MGRKRKVERVEQFNFFEKVVEETITLNAYLANFSKHRRNLDKVIIKWFRKKDNSNPVKTEEEWNRIIKGFFTETE